MNTKGFIISSTTGFSVVLLVIGGTGTNANLFDTGYAQTATLGAPIFVEEGGGYTCGRNWP